MATSPSGPGGGFRPRPRREEPNLPGIPRQRGHGSLANITENPHAGLLFVDFIQDKVGLHVNGAARILSNKEVLACPDLADTLRAEIAAVGGRRPERWVLVTVEEAYIHCSKHIPRLEKVGKEVRQWGTDDVRAKGGDYFRAKSAQEPLGGAAGLTGAVDPQRRASPRGRPGRDLVAPPGHLRPGQGPPQSESRRRADRGRSPADEHRQSRHALRPCRTRRRHSADERRRPSPAQARRRGR